MEIRYFERYVKDKYRNCLVLDHETNLDVTTIGPDIDNVVIEGDRLRDITIPDNVACLTISTRTDRNKENRFKLMPNMIPNTVYVLQLQIVIDKPDLVPDSIEYLSLPYMPYDYRYLPKQLLILEVDTLELLSPKMLEKYDDYYADAPTIDDLAEIVFPETLQLLFISSLESDYDWRKIQIPKSLHYIQFHSYYFEYAHITIPESVDIVIYSDFLPKEDILRNIPNGIYICGNNPIGELCCNDGRRCDCDGNVYDYYVIDSMVRHPFGGYIAKIIHKKYKKPSYIGLVRKPAKSARK